MLDQARERGLSDACAVATVTALTAQSIAQAYRDFLGPVDELVASGGGARNRTLLGMIEEALPGTDVTTIQAYGIDPDAKEAIAFALLGYTTLHGWPGNVPSATGATHPVVLGSITPGRNYRDLLHTVVAAPREPARWVRVAGTEGKQATGG
jgi:anhydro-N-acetylmuramic acid kinase